MTKLSEKKGGGLIYNPPRMLFDGSTGYYSKTSVTVSGNKVSMVAQTKRASFTGDTYEVIGIVGNTYTRCQIIVISSNHSTLTNRQAKIQCDVQNSAGAGVCKIISSVTVLDDEPHMIRFQFDGDAGTASLVIDGIEVDDTGNPDRVAPTTATLETGSGFACAFGASTSGTLKFGGNIAMSGYRDALTTWSDIMDQYGNPKQTDFSGWLFGHFAGKMDESVGTAGAMTKNGTITLVDPGECPHIGLPTQGDAMPSNLDVGKVAWVNGREITGVRAVPDSVILEYPFPTDQAGSYTRNLNDAVAKHPQLEIEAGSPCTLTANGFLNADSGIGWARILNGFGAIPANPGIRVYEMWGYLSNTTPTADYGIGIRFNVVDTNNYWVGYMTWSGSAWQIFLAEIIAGAFNLRGSATSVSTSIDWPCHYDFKVWDTGDRIYLSLDIFETDDASVESRTITYSTASRSKKDETEFDFRFNNLTYLDVFVRGIRVYDASR